MLHKILIGAAVAAVVSIGVFVASRKKENKEDPRIIEKIKKAAAKKVLQILCFVGNHEKEIEEVTTIVGLVSSAIGIASAVKKFKREDVLKKQAEDLKEQLNSVEKGQKDLINDLAKYVEICTNSVVDNQRVINDNQKVIGGDIIKIADKLGVQILAVHEE